MRILISLTGELWQLTDVFLLVESETSLTFEPLRQLSGLIITLLI